MKITLYYDDSCSLCTTNALHMQAKNPRQIDIISVDMGLADLTQVGISRIQAMTYVCVKDQLGTIHKGMDAIRLLCAVAEVRIMRMSLAKLLHMPIIKQLCAISYPFFARNRYYFPRWVIRLMYGTVITVDQCNNGHCSIPPAKRK